jgi:hypothetical protein
MKKNTLIICFALVITTVKIFAQSNARQPHDNLNFSSGSSPNGAGMGGGESINVDAYTGKLSVGIPIYSFGNTASGLSHNISLNYDGGGVQVDAIASNIGLNWQLNFGGGIQRQVNGLPDEQGIIGTNIIQATADPSDLKNIIDNKTDSEFDTYYFSAGNNGGSFIIDNAGEFIFNQKTNIKIEKIVTAPNIGDCPNIKFIITLPDGTKYYYENFNCSKLDYLDDNKRQVYASNNWYITKIVAPFSTSEILFTYDNYTLDFVSGKSFNEYLPEGGFDIDEVFYSFKNIKEINLKIAEKRIAKINYPDGTEVEFLYSSFNRRDLITDKAIEQIKISNNGKEYFYKLEHSYLGSNSESDYQAYSIINESNSRDFRLLLKKIGKSAGSIDLPGYEFTYYNGLPARFSNIDVDKYGFKGEAENRFIALPGLMPGSDRSVQNVTKVQKGSLYKIKNPLGGLSTIGFENNQIECSSLSEVTLGTFFDTYTYPINTSVPIPEVATPAMTATNSNYSAFTHQMPILPKPVGYTSIYNTVYYKIYIKPIWDQNNCFIETKNGGQVIPISAYKYENIGSSHNISNRVMKYSKQNQNFSIIIKANVNDDICIGTLVTANPNNCGNTPLNDAFEIIKIEYYNAECAEKIGGLRVRGITMDDNILSSTNIVKSYKYVNEDGTSSGIVLNRPKFNLKYTEYYAPVNVATHPGIPIGTPPAVIPTYDGYYLTSNNVYSLGLPQANIGTTYQYDVRFGNPINDVFNTNGGYVAYKRVEEYQGTTTNYLSKTVTDFSTFLDYPMPADVLANSLKGGPSGGWEFLHGLPKKVRVYTKNGTLKSETDYTYTINQEIKNQADYVSAKVNLRKHPGTDITDFTVCNYYPLTGYVFPNTTTTKEYFDNGQFVTTSSSQSFDPVNMVPLQSGFNTSLGESIVTKYRYAHDFSTSGVIADLNTYKINVGPIVTEVWKGSMPNTRMLNAQVSKLQNTNAGIRFAKGYSFKSLQPKPLTTFGGIWTNALYTTLPSFFEEGGHADLYDNLGNVLQTSFKGKFKSAIYDYNNHYLVAEIENAKWADCAYTGFETYDWGFGGWNFTAFSASYVSSSFTGNKAYSFGVGNSLQKTISIGKEYIITLWANAVPPIVTTTINGYSGPVYSVLTPSVLETHNGWTMYKYEIGNASNVAITTPVSIPLDEVRLYPKNASMTTYSYEPLYGKISICDGTNKTIHTIFDEFGRPKLTKDIDGNILNKTEYEIQQPY